MNGKNFHGKSVVITGAGGGLGRALITAFARDGARVIACDKAPEMLQDIGTDLTCCFDLKDISACDQAAHQLIAQHGPPGLVINNAGLTWTETLDASDAQSMADEITLNLTGSMAFCTPLARAMAGRAEAALVFVSSVNAQAHFGNPAYSAAKAGLLAYMRAVAVEYGPSGLRANAVCPGSIRTAAWDHRIKRDAHVMEKIARHYPLGRIVEVTEVVAAIQFLASPAASGITGATLNVDAGLTAGNTTFIRDMLEG